MENVKQIVSSSSFYKPSTQYVSPSERRRLRALSFTQRSSYEETPIKKPVKKKRKLLQKKRKNDSLADIVIPIRCSPRRPRDTNRFFRNIVPAKNAVINFTPRRGLKFAPSDKVVTARTRKLMPKFIGQPLSKVIADKCDIHQENVEFTADSKASQLYHLDEVMLDSPVPDKNRVVQHSTPIDKSAAPLSTPVMQLSSARQPLMQRTLAPVAIPGGKNVLPQPVHSSSKTITKPPQPSKKRYIVPRCDGRQMILDAGQKRFGVTQCAECGMMYAMGEQEDETAHSEYHHRSRGVLAFKGWKHEHGLIGYSDGRIIRVLPTDGAYHLKRIVDIVNFSSGVDVQKDVAAKLKQQNRQYFLFILNSKFVGGIAIAENIDKGYRVLPNEADFCSSAKPEVCVLGIHTLWTAPWYRRHKVATRLLEAVRKWFLPHGEVVEWDRVAFSDPSEDGRSLAAKVTGRRDFLVYSFVDANSR